MKIGVLDRGFLILTGSNQEKKTKPTIIIPEENVIEDLLDLLVLEQAFNPRTPDTEARCSLKFEDSLIYLKWYRPVRATE